jgi:peptidoglycan/LPS O-acetylase OafA/YrhL
MSEQSSAAGNRQAADGLATTALIVNVIAVLASALCLATFVVVDGTFALGVGAIALVFTAVMAVLAARQREEVGRP